jgi:hypothetical protein
LSFLFAEPGEDGWRASGSAPARRLNGRDINLAHLHHGLEGVLCGNIGPPFKPRQGMPITVNSTVKMSSC